MILIAVGLEVSGKHVHLQCVFHSIRFKVNKRLAVWDRWPFFMLFSDPLRGIKFLIDKYFKADTKG